MNDRRRNIFVLTTVVALLIGSLVVIFTKPTKLGLDLQGGVQLVYEARPTKQQPKINQESLDRALDIMRDRVDSLGVAEPELQRSGSDQIEVSLPGVKNAERAADQVGTTAQMYFYDWEPNILDADCKTNPEEVNGGQQPISGLYNAVKQASKCPPEIDANNTTNGLWYAFDKKSHAPINDGIPDETKAALEEDLQSQNLTDKAEILEVPEGIIVLRAVDDRDPDQKRGQLDQWWVLKDNPVLGGTDIKNPEQNFEGGSGGPPIVTMEFSDKGRKAFADTTRAIAQRGADNAAINGGLQDPINASHHFAVRLDNALITTPYINFRENPDGIDGQQGAQISGGFTIQTAQDLARLLKTGALPVRLELISRSQVSATLGKQALDQGLIAGIAGFAIVALFLLVFYRVMGVIAVAALGIYAIYLLALIKLIPITMTLPGIAGLILTIGVAADANIVIFERVKEEIRHGRSVSAGIAQGYKKGFATIVDANVVTLLVAFILFILATAGVKGFAFVLGVGTMVSLFTAVFATQAILLSLREHEAAPAPVRAGRGEEAQADHVRLHGRVEVVLLDVRPDPADLRARDRRQGAELRHRLRVGHADHRGAREAGHRRAGARRDRAGRVRRRQDPDGRQQGAGPERGPDLRRDVRARPTRSRTSCGRRSGSAASRRSPRSGRRSARRSPTRRWSRSSPRCA